MRKAFQTVLASVRIEKPGPPPGFSRLDSRRTKFSVNGWDRGTPPVSNIRDFVTCFPTAHAPHDKVENEMHRLEVGTMGLENGFGRKALHPSGTLRELYCQNGALDNQFLTTIAVHQTSKDVLARISYLELFVDDNGMLHRCGSQFCIHQ